MVRQQKIVRPPCPCSLIAAGRKAHPHGFAKFFDRVEYPGLGARESVRRRFRIVRLVTKLGKADRDAAANRASRRELRVLAQKDHFLRARRAPRGKVRAMQVDFRRRGRAADAHPRKPTIPGSGGGYPSNGKPFTQFIDIQRGTTSNNSFTEPTGTPACVSLPAASSQCSVVMLLFPFSYAYVLPSSWYSVKSLLVPG